MDTSNSAQTINYLYSTMHREDELLANKFWEAVKSIVKDLMPVLKYITAPRFISRKNGGYGYTCHCIKIGRNRLGTDIYIDKFGGTFDTETGGDKEYLLSIYNDANLLRDLPFEELVASLQKVLHEAKEKREQHLASINERVKKIDEIMAILNR